MTNYELIKQLKKMPAMSEVVIITRDKNNYLDIVYSIAGDVDLGRHDILGCRDFTTNIYTSNCNMTYRELTDYLRKQEK